jgi:ATP-binding cassette subfamily F protein 3
MSLVALANVGLSFGAFDVFQGVTASIPNDGRIGLIGPNGIGKTSLLMIAAGLSAPTAGTVTTARGRRLGYLRQEAADAFADHDNSLWAEMQGAFAGLRRLEAGLREMEARMAAGDHTPELLQAYGAAQAEFEHAGGYEIDQRIKLTLQGLGFTPAQYDQSLRQFSGGQKTRALLARLLLERPDLLILDEPTNHLDSDAVEWLEHTLEGWPGALLIVSHDRYFLDNTVSVIWEMGRSGLEVYRGNYSAYLKQRQERWERAQQVYAEEIARLRNEHDFVQRNIARATTNARAVGVLKRLSRDIVIAERFGIQALRSNQSWSQLGLDSIAPLGVDDAIRRINALPAPANLQRKGLNIRLRQQRASGELVLRTQTLSIGYADGDGPLFETGPIELWRGECAAIIGPNGVGKTTFLKTLLGQLPPLGGEIKQGAGIKIGYFAQTQEALNPEATVLDELLRHKAMPEQQARSMLGAFLFSGDDHYKQVKMLSGGERGRLALAILSLEGANLLLLDEPTNHLDIPAQEVLQEVLEHFEGTILLVSHDRYLVDRLGTQIWEVRRGALTIFKGTYREYVAAKQAQIPAPAPANGAAPKVHVDARPAAPPKPDKTTQREAKKRAQALAALEDKIHAHESRLKELHDAIQAAGGNFAQARALSQDYAGVERALEGLLTEWETLAAA